MLGYTQMIFQAKSMYGTVGTRGYFVQTAGKVDAT